MLAIGVLTISTAGVMTMQKASVLGNLDARKLDVASSIAQTWLDRLATDASDWNTQTPLATATTLVLGTLYANAGTYVTPTPSAGPWSAAFDIMGRDVTVGDSSTVFCTRIMVDQMAVDSAGNPSLLRATVMVFWPTQLLGSGAPTACPGPTQVSLTPGIYHQVFAAESLRRSS